MEVRGRDTAADKRAARGVSVPVSSQTELLVLAVYVDHIDAKHGAKDDARTPRSNGCFFSGAWMPSGRRLC